MASAKAPTDGLNHSVMDGVYSA